jgi:hypothetical protein
MDSSDQSTVTGLFAPSADASMGSVNAPSADASVDSSNASTGTTVSMSETLHKEVGSSMVPVDGTEPQGTTLYRKITNDDGSISFVPATQGGGRSKKMRMKRGHKKGGDPAGVVTAGTLLMIQAAARNVLKKQKGGQVIASSPAPLSLQAPTVGGSVCGMPPQEGGKKKSRKQRGGMAELKEAFNTMVTDLKQEGGKKKSRKQRGGASCQGAPLEDAFPGIDTKIVNEQTGGKKKSRKQRGGMADLKEAFEAMKQPEQVQEGGKKKSRKQRGGMADLKEAFEAMKQPAQEGGKKKSRKQKGGEVSSILQSIQQSLSSLKA